MTGKSEYELCFSRFDVVGDAGLAGLAELAALAGVAGLGWARHVGLAGVAARVQGLSDGAPVGGHPAAPGAHAALGPRVARLHLPRHHALGSARARQRGWSQGLPMLAKAIDKVEFQQE